MVFAGIFRSASQALAGCVQRCPRSISCLAAPITSNSVFGNISLNRFSINSAITKMSKPNIVFVLGAPGSGKGTMCGRIVDTFGYVHLSAGDLLREERNRKGSEFGELIETYIRNGQIVPVEITCSLLENAMNQNIKDSEKYNFLIDGFPRNQDNLEGWTRKMSEKVNLQFVLVLNCAEDMCVQRCLKRGLSSNRSDDNEESLKKRFQTFINDSMPIINHYKEQDLVKEVDGQRSADEVFEDVQQLFKQ